MHFNVVCWCVTVTKWWLLWSDGDTVHHNSIHLLRISPWRRPECRPKHVGENFMGKSFINTEMNFVCYLFVFVSDWCTEDETFWNVVFTVCVFVAGTIGLLKHLCYREFYALQIRVIVMCLPSVQYLQICKCQNHSLQDVIKLLLINIWSCFRSTSKHTVEVMLTPSARN